MGRTVTREAPRWLARPGDQLARALSVVGIERSARMLAALLSAPLALVGGGFDGPGLVAFPLIVYVMFTALLRRGRYLRASDLLVSAVVIAVAGAQITAFLPFLVVAVAGPAVRGGVLAGLAAGGTLALLTLARAVLPSGPLALGMDAALPVAVLLPLVGLATAAGAQVYEDQTVRERFALQQANRLLTTLQQLAGDLPGGLDAATIASELIAEVRRLPGVSAAVVFTGHDRLVRPLVASGIAVPSGVHLRAEELRTARQGHRPVRTERLPDPLRPLAGDHDAWRLFDLGRREDADAWLLVGFTQTSDAHPVRDRLERLAEDGGLALDNARLFAATQLRAADAARRHVAAQLHDGVAQSLAHVRLELDLLARQPPSDAEELARLARVTGTALDELRQTIAGLREPANADIGRLLEQHVEDLRSSSGPMIELERRGEALLDPSRADDVLRIAQEALSNALRHADATRITLQLQVADGELVLVVSDDGRGTGSQSDAAGGGVGLSTMHERAARLRGGLQIGPGDLGGTEVRLRLPLSGAAHATRVLPEPDGATGSQG